MRFRLDERIYTVDGDSVRRARLRKRMTVTQLANACGWSPSFQHAIESRSGTRIKEGDCMVLAHQLGWRWEDCEFE